MIGGIDVRLPSRAGIESVEVAVRAIRQFWPRAVFENADTGERFDTFWQIPFGEVQELFAYRDGAVADIWDEQGAIREVFNTMIHIIYDEGLITAVIDERTPEMKAILDGIRSGLGDSILFVPAALQEAA